MLQIDTSQYIPFCAPDTTIQEPEHIDTAVFSLDSILVRNAGKELEVVESVFKGHCLQVADSEPIPRQDTGYPSWIFGVCILIVVSLLLFVKTHGLSLKAILGALFSNRAMDRTVRENNLNHIQVMAPIAIIWSSIVSLIVFYLAHRFSSNLIPELDSWRALLYCLILMVGTTTLYHVRNMVFRLVGHTFEQGDASMSYIMSNYFYLLIESVVAVPLVMVLYYGSGLGIVALYVLGGTMTALFVIRVVRGIKIFLTQSNSSHMHLFYYLCIVEFVPFLVLLKVINIL